MPVTVVVGCQWGDEGKGKIVDALAGDADWVARFQGGANAGHTLIVAGENRILHLVPSGIFRPNARCVIGNGVVVDPLALVEEIAVLEAAGVDFAGRLLVSRQAHCVTPMHRWIERLTHADEDFGTTKRGIGPAYADKMSRRGLRMEVFESPELLREALRGAWDHWEAARRTLGAADPPGEADRSFEAVADSFESIGPRLRPLLADTAGILLEAHDRGERILCEGAQGALLDIDHGSYPFVTSSTATSGGACVGLGLPPSAISDVVGVSKAFATRVGAGPFPTEMEPATADPFREQSGEYGATTGRPRRCGWLDLVLLRRALRLNGVTRLVMTKVDVLRGIDPLRLCIAYEIDGERVETADPSPGTLSRVRPVYEELPGWTEDLSEARSWQEVCPRAKAYLARVAEGLGRPVDRISVGPDRGALITPA